MSENKQEISIGMTNIEQNSEIPSWKVLDEVCRKWAVLSLHEKDLLKYEISAATYR